MKKECFVERMKILEEFCSHKYYIHGLKYDASYWELKQILDEEVEELCRAKKRYKKKILKEALISHNEMVKHLKW